jgi:hypothetical protein
MLTKSIQTKKQLYDKEKFFHLEKFMFSFKF